MVMSELRMPAGAAAFHVNSTSGCEPTVACEMTIWPIAAVASVNVPEYCEVAPSWSVAVMT